MRGKIELQCEPMQVAIAVYQAAESVHAAIKTRGQQFEVRVPPQLVQIAADPARMTPILENLLTNARRTRPRAALFASKSTGPHVVEVHVIDNGNGIEPAKIAGGFEHFH